MPNACFIRVHGVVQGVGFRPFVYRLARAKTLAGWVLNGDQGVEIHLEGDDRKHGGLCSRDEKQAACGSKHRGR